MISPIYNLNTKYAGTLPFLYYHWLTQILQISFSSNIMSSFDPPLIFLVFLPASSVICMVIFSNALLDWFHFIISLMSYHILTTKIPDHIKNSEGHKILFWKVRLPVLLIKINCNSENYSNLCKPQFVQPPNDNINNKSRFFTYRIYKRNNSVKTFYHSVYKESP